MSSELNGSTGNSKNDVKGLDNSWSAYIRSEDILEDYDTVIEVYAGDTFFDFSEKLLESHETNYNSLNDETVVPDDHYNNPIQGMEDIRDALNGETLLVAFGFDGKDLPNYAELENVNTEGNWWDHPEDLDTDILVDRKTYEGALRVPFNMDKSSHTLLNGLKEVIHLTR